MKKIYILDTNILMLDPDCLKNFEDNDIVLSTTVVKELNKMKTRMDQEGKNARFFNKMIEELSEKYDSYEGIPLESGGKLKLVTYNKNILEEIIEEFGDSSDNDDKILSVAIQLHREYEFNKDKIEKELEDITDELEREEKIKELKELKPVILVTRDYNLRIRARRFKVVAQTYTSDQIAISETEIYKGWRILPVSEELIADYYTKNIKGNEGFVFKEKDYFGIDFYPNEYVILVDEKNWKNTDAELQRIYKQVKVPILRYHKKKDALVGLYSYSELLSEYNIQPKNPHQRMLVDMIFNTEIPQKSIIGAAGTGKTLFSLLCSILMVNKLHTYNEIIITRPPIVMEYDLGFLPGNEQQKMDPYLRGFKGNLNFITSKKFKSGKDKDKAQNNPQNQVNFTNYNIKTEAMSYMRGETTHKQIVIIDESQNANSLAMKTALTRTGSDSIIILLGDITQIDNHLLDATDNGLTYAVELMKDDDLAGHITLVECERSELAKRIADKWDKHVHMKKGSL